MNQLLEPIRIGNVELRNRVVFPPMTTGFEDKGEITEQSINFYVSIAKGGTGLIILGDAGVGFGLSGTPAFYDDRFIPMLCKLTESIHEYGAKISPQLFHQEYFGEEMMKVPREQVMAKIEEGLKNFGNNLTHEQIEKIKLRHVEAAKRARTAGFDIIQIHGDRLIGQFFSPILNKRKDKYGGNLENRARLALEIVKQVKEEVGDEMPIDFKLSIIRPNEGSAGPTLDEAKEIAPWLVEAGVNSFHVSLANHLGVHHVIPPMGSKPYGCFLELAEAIKKTVNVPVATVGRIIDPEFAEAIIKEGKADLVSLGRGLLADPEWPLKVKEGRNNDIRKCIMCNQGCTDRLMRRQYISCSINAAVGKEANSRITKTETGKHVLVVGGGPAGMETARVAALRGHKVTLIEKSNRLGGQLKIASVPPHKEEMNLITEYLVSQVEKLGVNIQLAKEVTLEVIDKEKPDVVIIATGAIPLIPGIKGVEGNNVKTAWDVLSGEAVTGKRVIVVGGGSVGCETAEFLARDGKEVTIVEMLERIGMDMSPTVIPFLMERMKEYGIKVLTKNKLEEINEEGVITIDEGKKKHKVESDTVILAMGARPNNELASKLSGRGIEVISVGDCAYDLPGQLFDAVHDGYFTALEI